MELLGCPSFFADCEAVYPEVYYERISLQPLIEVDSLCVLPRRAGHEVQMPWEDVRIYAAEQVRNFGHSNRLLPGREAPCFGSLLGFFYPAFLEGRPVDLLKIEKVQTVELFGIPHSSGLKSLSGQASSRYGTLLTRRQQLTKCLAAASAENELRRHRQMIEMPLRHAGFALSAAQRNFEKRRLAFVSFRSHLIGKDRANQFQRFRLLAD